MTIPESADVNAMFGRIARRYDLANRLVSIGLDCGWRRALVRAVKRVSPGKILDLATGSGDVAFALGRELGPSIRILGMDFCPPMLVEAERKKKEGGAWYAHVRFAPGDGLALPLPDGQFDAVTISFGLRNMSDRHRSLQEIRRVLRPGGRLFVLEFSQPQRWVRPAYFFYLRHVVPAVAGWATGERGAYLYLDKTIEEFPDRAALAAEIRAAGFGSVTSVGMTFGTVALHEARK